MAALASSAVSLYPTDGSAESYPNGKGDRGVIQRRLKLVLTGQGGQTNTIGAAALGFGTILTTSNLFDDVNNAGYAAFVDPVTNVILLMGDAAPLVPVDVTTTAAYITVTGTPKPLSGTYP